MLDQKGCVTHSRGGDEALQRCEVCWLKFSSHYYLRTAEELVEAVLSHVTYSALGEVDGDGPEERRRNLAVEFLEGEIKENYKYQSNYK